MGRPFRLAVRTHTQQRTRRETVLCMNDFEEYALFDLRRLAGDSSFGRIDVIERRQSQLTEPDVLRVDDVQGLRVQPLNKATHVVWLDEHSCGPHIEVWFSLSSN